MKMNCASCNHPKSDHGNWTDTSGVRHGRDCKAPVGLVRCRCIAFDPRTEAQVLGFAEQQWIREGGDPR